VRDDRGRCRDRTRLEDCDAAEVTNAKTQGCRIHTNPVACHGLQENPLFISLPKKVHRILRVHIRTIDLVLLEGMTLGWFLIILGALLLLVEVHSPSGFFAAVPATILIIFVSWFSWGWIFHVSVGIIIAVIVAIVASCVTVTVYSRMTPNKVPTTISRDSLVGKEGR